ncbi:MAG: lipopolysaccharide biosynthesis protein [Paraglaciecola chathamensis]
MNSSVAKSSAYTLLANVLLASSHWLLFVIIAKFYSGLELGQFVLALSFISPAFLFASFKLRTLIVVDRQWQFSLNEYFSARLLANAIVTLGCILFVVYQWKELMQVVTIVLLYRWCDSLTEFAHSYQRRLQYFNRIAVLMAARSLTTMLAVTVVAINGGTFINLLASWALTASVFCLFDLWLLRSSSGENESQALSIAKFISYGSLVRALALYKQYFTVACALVISSLFVYLPNFFLNQQMGVESAGYFASISYFLVAGGIIVNSLSQVLTPKLAIYYQRREQKAFSRLLRQLCLIGLLLGLFGVGIAWILGGFFLELFYTPYIAQFHGVLTLLMLAAGVRYIYIFVGTALASIQSFAVQTKIYACGLSAMALSCYLLIPEYGLYGAAYAMLIATLLECLLFALSIRPHVSKAFSVTTKVVA